ncbi:MAG: DUF2214 family protein [Proteobacteria bacterium]|nr:DUF2214 family protein [Pseudomonadota bacterium]
MTAALVSALHILGIALSFASVSARARALKTPEDHDPILRADNLWGISAIIVVGTGLARAFGGLEKGTPFYTASSAFHVKMGLLGLVFLLEVAPAVTLVKWRIAQARGGSIDTSGVGKYVVTSRIQAALMVGMVFAGAFMAQGIG